MSDKKFETYGFGRINLIILGIAIFLIIIGYILLSGGNSPDGVSFNKEVFSPMRISVAPVVLTIGYVGILVAILWRDRKRKGADESTPEQK